MKLNGGMRNVSEDDIVLLRQHHCLLGEGGSVLAAHWCIRRSGDELWLSLFHKLMLYQLFLESPAFSDRHDGVAECYLPINLGNLSCFGQSRLQASQGLTLGIRQVMRQPVQHPARF